MRRSTLLLHVRAIVAAALLTTASAARADLDDVRAELTRNIQTSQRELSAAEATVARERGDLAQRLAAAQNRVLDLRERAVAARRLADEQTLTLQQIETRLNEWREQSRFQSNLLAGFLDKTGRRLLSEQGAIDLRRDLTILTEHLNAQEGRLYPRWQQERLVLADGGLAEGDVLHVGPLAWFHRAQPEQSGLVRKEEGMTRVSLQFSGAAASGIEDLHQGSAGVITFDPTLTRALLLAETQESLWQHLRRGGFWAIPIVLFGLFASTIAVLKAVSLYRLPIPVPALAERVQSALARGGDAAQKVAEQVQGPQGELVRIAISAEAQEVRDDRLHGTLLQQRIRLERWLSAIALTASVSPLLGLLGTVSGMISTFQAMSLFGAGDASAVSGGVGEALINTELGLVVAIPALLAHALLSRKAKSYLAQLESDAVNLSRLSLPAGAA